jgi:hypothetical protein
MNKLIAFIKHDVRVAGINWQILNNYRPRGAFQAIKIPVLTTENKLNTYLEISRRHYNQ